MMRKQVSIKKRACNKLLPLSLVSGKPKRNTVYWGFLVFHAKSAFLSHSRQDNDCQCRRQEILDFGLKFIYFYYYFLIYFEIILNLLKSCKDSTKSCMSPSSNFLWC